MTTPGNRQPPVFDPGFLSIVAVWAGAQRLLGITPSWQAIADRIKIYSLAELINVTGRIDALLRNVQATELSVQLEVCAGLAGAEQAAMIQRRLALMAFRDQEHGELPSTYMLFGHRSLMTVLQVAAHVCAGDEGQIRANKPLTPLLEALLITNDLVMTAPHSPEGADLSTPAGRSKWIYYMAVASDEGSEPAVHLASRAVDLFLTDKSALREDPDYVDLPALFTEATSLTSEGFGLALVVFLGTLYRINATNVADRGVDFRPAQFMGGKLRFTRNQVDRLFALGGQSVTTFVEEMREAYPVGAVRPYYHLPVERSPLVRFEGEALCASLPLLEQRFTMGLYHVLLNARSGPAHRGFRDQLLRYFGRVFEDYVRRLLERITMLEVGRQKRRKPRRAPRGAVVYEDQLQQALGLPLDETPPLCDAVLKVGNCVILFEAKARLFSVAARGGVRPDEFFAKLSDIVGGTRQLDSTLDHLAKGSFASLGLEPGRIVDAFPVIVSMQNVFLTPLLRSWMQEKAKEAGYLTRGHIEGMAVRDLDLMSCTDLEWLELAGEKAGVGVVELLRRRDGEGFARGQSVANWAATRHPVPALEGERLDYHAAIFDRLGREAIEFFRAHQHEGHSTPSGFDEVGGT